MGCAAVIKQDVGRLDVAVNHALLMSIVNGEADGSEEADDILGSGKLLIVRGCMDIIGQRPTLNILHDHISLCLRLRSASNTFFCDMEVVDSDDIGMA